MNIAEEIEKLDEMIAVANEQKNVLHHLAERLPNYNGKREPDADR